MSRRADSSAGRNGVYWLAALVLASSLAATRLASAQVSQEALAETLFQEAKTLIEKGDYASACPKLAESHRADPGGGTVLLLAICYEKIGKTASAWLKFNEALALARADRRDDRERRAQESLRALEPRLSRLTLEIPQEVLTLDGLQVELDGVVIPSISSRWTLPVDPGEHHLRASARGRRAFETTLVVTEEGTTRSVVVPALEALSAPTAAAPAPAAEDETAAVAPSVVADVPPPAPDRRRSGLGTQRSLALALGGLSVVSLGVGGYFGVVALGENSEARNACPDPDNCLDQNAVNTSSDALQHARVSDVFVGAGVLGLAISTTLYLTARRRKNPASSALLVAPSPSGVWLGARTRF